MYEIGKVYIWQNQVAEFAYLNGKETTVIGGPAECVDTFTGKASIGWKTDTPYTRSDSDGFFYAAAGELRPKDPPKGEQSILDLFKLPDLEPA